MRAILLALCGVLLTAAWPHPVEAQAPSSSHSTTQSPTKTSNKPAGNSPVPPFQYQGRGATLDEFDVILAGPCDRAYSQGHQLDVSWQKAILTNGKAPLVQGLITFRQAATACLQQIGSLINATAKDVPDITSKISGSWTFSADLWQSTNQFVVALGGPPPQASPQLVALVTPQSKNFSVALDRFSKWIDETKERVAGIRRQDLAEQKPN
jgi:hypothetical protein